MTPTTWLAATRALLLVALGASMVLYLHYLAPEASSFCGNRAGCEAVRQSSWSSLGHPALSLPLVGLVWHGILFWWSFGQRASSRAAWMGALCARPGLSLFVGCFLGAVGAAQLLLYQWLHIGQWCLWCVVVDTSAVLAAVTSLGGAVAESRLAMGASVRTDFDAGLRRAVWWALAVVALGAAPLWQALVPAAQVPPAVRELYAPGALNVVEVADFQCPFCRQLHPMLQQRLEERATNLNWVRLHVPLPGHPLAEPAARAALCAEEQGKGPAMAEALFAMDLSAQALERQAEQLGLEPTSYDTCLRSERISARLRADRQRIPDEPAWGLPMLFIGEQRLVGVPSAAVLDEALARGDLPARWQPGAMTVAMTLGVVVVGLVAAGRRRSP